MKQSSGGTKRRHGVSPGDGPVANVGSSKKDSSNGKNSTRSEKKLVAKERKAKRQKNFDIIQEATKLWETLRQSTTAKAKKVELVGSILEICGDRVGDLAASHTASRIIQSCVKHGNGNHRVCVQEQVLPKIVELAKNPYGRFIVSKLIATAPKDQLPVYFKALKGKAPELLRHPAGTHVLDELYCVANGEQRRMMAAEFYGKEYSLFSAGTLNKTQGAPESLAALLSAVEGQKQLAIIRHIASTLTPVIEKGLVDNQLAHTLISEYLKSAPPSLIEDSVESLSGDALLHMIHTHEGVEAACMVLAYGSAKDRKKAIKACKGHVMAAVTDEWGYLAICTAVSVTDDTSLLKKSLVTDIQSEISEVIQDKHGHKVLLHLLSPYSKRYFSPELLNIMKPPVKMISKRIEPSEEGGEAQTVEMQLGISKKDDAVRRKEIFSGGLWDDVSNAILESAKEFLCKQYASDVVVEACIGGQGNFIESEFGSTVLDKLHQAIVDAATAEDILTDYFGSRALRRIIIASQNPDEESAKKFTRLLWQKVLKGRCNELKDSHAAKIVAALIQCGCPEIVTVVKKELKGVKNPTTWAEKFAGKVNKK